MVAEHYPPPGFHFKVTFELDGVLEGVVVEENDFRFQEVSGLSAEVAVETLHEGGENRFSHRLPGRTKFANLVLKRGLVTSSALIEWFRNAIEALEIKPVDMAVTLLDEAHEELTTWNFVKAWPLKWSFSNLNAQNNSLMIETVELSYQYCTRL